ncbi:hypothetical protein RSAG8_08628, partial [Rhizoctonia solani AG-8 WAC10335]
MPNQAWAGPDCYVTRTTGSGSDDVLFLHDARRTPAVDSAFHQHSMGVCLSGIGTFSCDYLIV